MKSLLREPLVHFLLLGGALFGISAYFGPQERTDDEITVVVSAGKIEQIAAIFAKTWQRPPTESEWKGLVEDFVLEEIYYREALKMGIEQDDTMIRRRLRQKLEFLTEDIISQVTPSDEILQSYLDEHPEKFRSQPIYTFQQIYFNPDNHGEDPLKTITALAGDLRAGTQVEGDRTLLPEAFEEAPARLVDSTFGAGFAERLEQISPGKWSDPLPSGLGYHLVLLEKKSPGQVPSLEEARTAVQREWENTTRTQAREQFNAALLENYEVILEWPEAETSSDEDA